MNEVAKLYENADVNRDCNLYKHFTECPMKHTQCEDCENFVYPPFTAEKQLSLIKWLCQNTYRNYIHIRYERDINNWKIECNMIGIREFGNFDECFAGLINSLWQDLTDAERTQIKNILESEVRE